MSADPIDPDLTAFADQLAGLRPDPGTFGRDRVLFAAGRAVGLREGARAQRWRAAWPAAATILALVAAGEGFLLARAPGVRTVERVVVVREPAPPAAPLASAPGPDPAPVDPSSRPWRAETERNRLVDRIVRLGLDGLPASSPRLLARDAGPNDGDGDDWPDASAGPRTRSPRPRPDLGDPS